MVRIIAEMKTLMMTIIGLANNDNNSADKEFNSNHNHN